FFSSSDWKELAEMKTEAPGKYASSVSKDLAIYFSVYFEKKDKKFV
ncbi:MAG: hypothetical protein GY931_14915, partial [Maribacter sp.]|nr:hypothetical protein [Maribacter sp.]